jgi:hypothetical protein
VSVNPTYPTSAAASGSHATYTFTFPETWGYGVRIVGTPAGPAHFTSIAHLAVYYRDRKR